MGIHRKFIRWRMLTFKYIYHHPCLLFSLVVTFLVALSYLNSRLNLSLLYWQTFPESSVIFQENIRRLNKNVHRVKINRECEIFMLWNDSDKMPVKSIESVACQRIPPLPGSCDLADEIFFSEPQTKCSHQQTYNFCALKKSVNGIWEVVCNETQSEVCKSSLSIGRINKSTGILAWEESGTPLKTSEILTSFIQSSSLSDKSKHFGFCFIRCLLKVPNSGERFEAAVYDDTGHIYNSDENIIYAEQLLILPPQFKQSDSEMKLSPERISVNIILIDSVSRQHFFRSLPKSVSALKEVMSASSSEVTVFDFQLVQAVRSRTFETLQTIFSGDIDPSEKPFGTQDISPRPLNLSFLLKKFKSKGYHTLWIEDLCYLWEWGISKDLHFLNSSSSSRDTWLRMWKKLSENFVDSVEVTLAMCKVLKANNVADHFHGPDSVCFNGRHQHEYLLEYIQLYQQTLESRHQPYFVFTMTNVAHEDSGRRVQTLDVALAEYLKFAASLKNTLTVVFSDHGNAYGSFIQSTQEARIELFHPVMIFILPRTVAAILGEIAVNSLLTNTLRLVSFLDLHYTLNHIVDPESMSRHVNGQFKASRKGMFEPVPANRTCDDIPRIMPNLCICLDYDTPDTNHSGNILFAYFALGRLNDEIQRQLLLSQRKSSILASKDGVVAFQKCQRLVLVGVQNVRKSFGKGRTQTLKMDLHVQQSQVFFVAITVRDSYQGQGDHKAEIEMYDRITPYSMFSICADNIDLSLCICDTSQTMPDSVPVVNIPQEKDFQNMQLLPHFESLVQSIDNCLLFVTFKHTKGGVIFAANVCADKNFILAAELNTDDKILYYPPPRLPVLLPGGMVVLGFIYTENSESWTSSIQVSFKVITDLNDLKLGSS